MKGPKSEGTGQTVERLTRENMVLRVAVARMRADLLASEVPSDGDETREELVFRLRHDMETLKREVANLGDLLGVNPEPDDPDE